MASRRLVLLLGWAAAATSGLVFYCFLWNRRRSLSSTFNSSDYKPQRKFRNVLADNSTKPFVHLGAKETGKQELHPFHHEIFSLLDHPLKLQPVVLMRRLPSDMTEPYVWVQTKGQLEALAGLLNNEYEFAVDTEQHSLRSFHGFIALIQISTYKQDFLIDTIALHDEMSILQKVFADPTICKVLHGADSDSLWLQRDFHIYLVNLFDTARACDVLGKPQRSLAYLLQTYCGISTNKIFQRADWRLRPLPEEMVQYARTDVHYLLYVADCLRSELLQGGNTQQNAVIGNTSSNGCFHKSLFEECAHRSNTACLQLYEKDGVSTSPAVTAASLLSRYYSNLRSVAHYDGSLKDDERFQGLVYLLCEWRDSVARVEDESLRFVLSDQAILALAKSVPVSNDAIFQTICNADEAFQITEACKYMTPIPLPSPYVLHHIDFLSNVLIKSEGQSSPFSDNFLNPNGEVLSLESVRKEFSGSVNRNAAMRGHNSITGVEVGQYVRKKIRNVEHKVPRQWKLRCAEASRMKFVKKFSCKAPVYHNCRIFAGDGRLLCFCDRKKLDWYVDRGLAEFIDECPPSIRLLFEPKGRPEDENNEFYIHSKSNRCVGCGESSHYLRYRVIPSCYRQHFPEHMKSHRSHDIVLLCVDCHEVAHCAAEKYKRQISSEFDVPLFAKKVADSGKISCSGNDTEILIDEVVGGVAPIQLRTAAMALLRHSSTMPQERQNQLKEVLRTYYGGREITDQDVWAALLVGKGPRELRRLKKKIGKLQENVSMTFQDTDKINWQEGDATAVEGFTNLESQKEIKHCYYASNNTDIISHPGHQQHDEAKKEEIVVCLDSQGLEESCEVSRCAVNISKDIDDKEMETNNSHSNLLSESCVKEFYLDEPTTPGVNSRKSTPKFSLLGHGPHGKRVVEILLEQEGEEGIRQFCQRWRAVFVDALQPSFLPSGWDVLHSGRREFGEYSVYNPSRKGKQIP